MKLKLTEYPILLDNSIKDYICFSSYYADQKDNKQSLDIFQRP